MIWFVVSIALVCVVLFLKNKQDQLEESFQKRFAGQQILSMDKYARLIAQQSHGLSQVSGMGYLVLTGQELYFKLQLNSKEISIPGAALMSVGETRRMGGKNPLRTMLKVEFRTSDGQEDAIAFLVKDQPLWKAEIAKVMKKYNENSGR